MDVHIPSEFTICSQRIKVEVVEQIPDNSYGYFDSTICTIRIAKKILGSDNTLIDLTVDQIQNTMWHEILHVFQWFSKNETSEQEASTYAGYLCEFFKTMKI